MLKNLKQALFPNQCAGCELPIANMGYFSFCASCYELLSLNNGPRCEICDAPSLTPTCQDCIDTPAIFEQICVPYLYGGPLQEAICRIKFKREEYWATPLAKLLCSAINIQNLALKVTHIVPVPLGSKRLRERGFNQSGVLVREMAKLLNLKVLYALERSRETSPQSGLSQQERQNNVANAFISRENTLPEKILLIDDVITTGATLKSAAFILKSAGVKEVYGAALAHSDL